METTPDTDIDRDQVKARIVVALERRRRRRPGDEPHRVRALALARWCGIRPHGGPDSRKRGVRLVVHELRREGVPIVADRSGYWLAETAGDHVDYQEYRRRNGLTHLAEASRDRRSDPAADAAGQLGLFASS